jgi:hypothetical protein
LFAWRSGAREEFEVKDDGEAVAASGGRLKGDPRVRILAHNRLHANNEALSPQAAFVRNVFEPQRASAYD